ncbi:3-hydroxyacyl-coa dehydrogenase [Heliomicrobium modesticaldum Ice1]|uniref:3-hydroxyacyl-coa dehydrogenase n=1 Tax=Heliobacterium modesticaldum (strain ATCC 51547 / Ice1) TaxID=498761 RepID=B0TI25_HELMI|nr:3-hydroxyacyl-CoA dehydrogenase/enoyl-CoA hydratase family protein [Heliomicrobium modesticaldum]ABZ82698.1 3-hydroxyacyl-coa dehydrogenase [Heliomicrobium modesticaldum Ice1]
MIPSIQTVLVLGAGVMGSAIAAHLANAGRDVLLLDIVPKELTPEEAKQGLTLQDRAVRDRIAAKAKANLLKQKPSPLFVPEVLERIAVGNLEDDLPRVATADWVIEAIVERLDVKQALWKRVESYWQPGTIVSSNTSGVSINQIVADCSHPFRRHFMGTHFFNPPRYMKLLELIPCRETDEELIGFMKSFCEKQLGKGVVLAKDTPNFIANRIGTYGLLVTLQAMEKYGLTVDEVDALTGPVIGRPKSATFRTLDLVGLDVFVHVANNVFESTTDPEEKAAFAIPAPLRQMLEKGWLGDKSGQGFYRKEKGPQGSAIGVLDLNTFTYRPRKKIAMPSLETAKLGKGTAEKITTLVSGKDPAAQFSWEILKKVLLYSARKLPEIADDIVSVDEAMRWGFNWSLGPFETWDAIGLKESVARMRAEGDPIPPWVAQMLEDGRERFYEEREHKRFYVQVSGELAEVSRSSAPLQVADLRKHPPIRSNAGASLYDIGDDVAFLDFHSPKHAIGPDFLQMIRWSLEEVERNFKGLVIGNDGAHYCVGANLMLILLEAEDENWDEIDGMVRQFQQAAMAIKYSRRPVVVAPHGLTLGGGCELTMPAAAIQAAAETYIGLVEVGVGLIPGGTGHKELLLRAMDAAGVTEKDDLQPIVNRVFETIAMAKVSTSAMEAKQLGYIRHSDAITMNKDRQLFDAKQKVSALWEQGYMPPMPRKLPVVGEPGLALMKLGVYTLLQAGRISEHDAKIASKIAHVLSGGAIPAKSLVPEQYILDLEREAFLSLVGEPKSQERMRYMLAKGKPLRN